MEPRQHFPFSAQCFLFLVTPTRFSSGAFHVTVLHIKTVKELQNSFHYKPCFYHSELPSSPALRRSVPGDEVPKVSGARCPLCSSPRARLALCYLFECRRRDSKGRPGFSVFTEISAGVRPRSSSPGVPQLAPRASPSPSHAGAPHPHPRAACLPALPLASHAFGLKDLPRVTNLSVSLPI